MYMCIWEGSYSQGGHRIYSPEKSISGLLPFFGSSSLAILFGGAPNSSSLKGNLFMPELQNTRTHINININHCLNALNNQLTGCKTQASTKAHGHFLETTTLNAFYCESAKGCLGSKLLKIKCETSNCEIRASVTSPLLCIFC